MTCNCTAKNWQKKERLWDYSLDVFYNTKSILVEVLQYIIVILCIRQKIGTSYCKKTVYSKDIMTCYILLYITALQSKTSLQSLLLELSYHFTVGVVHSFSQTFYCHPLCGFWFVFFAFSVVIVCIDISTHSKVSNFYQVCIINSKSFK